MVDKAILNAERVVDREFLCNLSFEVYTDDIP